MKKLGKNIFDWVEGIGRIQVRFVERLGQYSVLFLKTIPCLLRKRFPWRVFVTQIQKIGYESISIVAFTSLFMGMVFAFSTGVYLDSKLKGVAAYTGGTIAVAFIRELGPMLTALLISGRSGSAVAAEIGSMIVNEQIDAVVTMGISPIQYILLPRILAGIISVPILVFISIAMGILGGSFIAMSYLGQTMSQYMNNALSMVVPDQVFLGFIKGVVFGWLILFISSARGFFVRGGSEAVGEATTQAVVISSIACVIADYLVTSILNI